MSASRAVSSSSSSSSGSAASSHFAKMRAVDRLAPANVKHNHDVVFFTLVQAETQEEESRGERGLEGGGGAGAGSMERGSPCSQRRLGDRALFARRPSLVSALFTCIYSLSCVFRIHCVTIVALFAPLPPVRPCDCCVLPPSSRTLVSILGGCCCGILGLTNWSGFAFYLVTALLTSVVLVGKLAATAAATGGLADAKSYVGSLSALTTDGLIDGCMSYVLFWTYVQQRRQHERQAGREADALKSTATSREMKHLDARQL